jgi:transposase
MVGSGLDRRDFSLKTPRLKGTIFKPREPPMPVATIGLDISKSVFQVHGVDALGETVTRERLTRRKMISFFKQLDPCLVGIEACGMAHHWARELTRFGHQVKLIPVQYVKPYVKRSKTDAADAEAICEAVARPNMRFVPIKTRETQAMNLLHVTRSQLVAQRTAMINCLRSGLAEFGIVSSPGMGGAKAVLKSAATDKRIPKLARIALAAITDAIRKCEAQVAALSKEIAAIAKSDDSCVRLATIPGIGPVTATTMVAVGGDLSRFPSGRHFAAWLGLTPRQHSSGETIRLGRITKAGDKTLRSLLVVGAFGLIRWAKANPKGASPWLLSLLQRRPSRVVAVALANKAARIAWALIVRGGTYHAMPVN